MKNDGITKGEIDMETIKSPSEDIEKKKKDIEEWEDRWKGQIEWQNIGKDGRDEQIKQNIPRLLKLILEYQKVISLQNELMIEQNKEIRDLSISEK
jgi:hypothetical protein